MTKRIKGNKARAVGERRKTLTIDLGTDAEFSLRVLIGQLCVWRPGPMPTKGEAIREAIIFYEQHLTNRGLPLGGVGR